MPIVQFPTSVPHLCAAPEPADSNELQYAVLHILEAIVVLIQDLQCGTQQGVKDCPSV